MRLTHPGDYYEGGHDPESKPFADLLRQHNPKAWDELREAYDAQLASVIISALIANALPLDITDDIRQNVWERAQVKITHFTYTRRGGLFVWLCDMIQQQIHLYNDIDSEEFLGLLRQDYEGAWTRLIRAYSAQLLQIARSKLVSHGLSADPADDLLQETWMTARQRIDTVSLGSSQGGRLFAWLYTILENHLRNYGRLMRLRDYLSLEDEISDERLSVNGSRSPEKELEKQELWEAYERALARLMLKYTDSVDREIIFRRLGLFQKPSEIIHHMQQKATRVYERTREAKRELREALKDYLPTADKHTGEDRYEQAK